MTLLTDLSIRRAKPAVKALPLKMAQVFTLILSITAPNNGCSAFIGKAHRNVSLLGLTPI